MSYRNESHGLDAAGEPTPPERVITFAEAEKIGAYELARRWGDRFRLPVSIAPEKAAGLGVDVRTADDELDELATMSALRSWLDRWTPTQIHTALRTGATVDQVAAATGKTTVGVAECWREWDAGQRRLWHTYPDMDRTAEHDQVAEILGADLDALAADDHAEL